MINMEKKAKDDELLKFNHSYYQQGKSLKIFSILFHLIVMWKII